jgi:hypothetical protein
LLDWFGRGPEEDATWNIYTNHSKGNQLQWLHLNAYWSPSYDARSEFQRDNLSLDSSGWTRRGDLRPGTSFQSSLDICKVNQIIHVLMVLVFNVHFQMYPVTLGCNIGTTITGIMAALVADTADALQVALAHLVRDGKQTVNVHAIFSSGCIHRAQFMFLPFFESNRRCSILVEFLFGTPFHSCAAFQWQGE